MENLLEAIDDIKEKITDQQYLVLMNSLKQVNSEYKNRIMKLENKHARLKQSVHQLTAFAKDS